jgi:hypothetical protein
VKNEASKTRSLKIAFIVNADHLRHLARVLGEASEQLEYTVGFSDGASMRYGDVEDIVKLPNSGERSITSLIVGTPEEITLDDIRYVPKSAGPGVPSTKVAVSPPSTAYVTLRKSNPAEAPSLEYTITSPQWGTVVYLGAELDNWVAAIRQWYSAGHSAGAVLPLIALLAPILAWGYLFQYLVPQTVRTLPWAKSLIVLLYVAEFGIFKLFPRGTFAIGRGATSHEFLVWLRRGVLAALAISIIAGVIANLITTHFATPLR